MASTKKTVPDDVKTNIRSVLLSKVGGVKIANFTHDYKELVQERIRFKQYGFHSLVEMMESIPDVCRIKEVGSQDYRLFGILDNPNILNHTARKAQFKAGKEERSRIKESAPATPASLTKKEAKLKQWHKELQPNLKGLYCICTPRPAVFDRRKYVDDFEKYGTVSEFSATKRYIFIRYADRQAALDALSHLEGKYDMRIPTEKNDPKYVIKQSSTKSKTNTEKKNCVEVYFGNLDSSVVEGDLKDLLKKHPILDIRMRSKDNSSFAFVEVRSKSEAEKLVEQFSGRRLCERPLVVQLSFDTARREGDGEQEDVNSDLMEKLAEEPVGVLAHSKKILESVNIRKGEDNQDSQESPGFCFEKNKTHLAAENRSAAVATGITQTQVVDTIDKEKTRPAVQVENVGPLTEERLSLSVESNRIDGSVDDKPPPLEEVDEPPPLEEVEEPPPLESVPFEEPILNTGPPSLLGLVTRHAPLLPNPPQRYQSPAGQYPGMCDQANFRPMFMRPPEPRPQFSGQARPQFPYDSTRLHWNPRAAPPRGFPANQRTPFHSSTPFADAVGAMAPNQTQAMCVAPPTRPVRHQDGQQFRPRFTLNPPTQRIPYDPRVPHQPFRGNLPGERMPLLDHNAYVPLQAQGHYPQATTKYLEGNVKTEESSGNQSHLAPDNAYEDPSELFQLLIRNFPKGTHYSTLEKLLQPYQCHRVVVVSRTNAVPHAFAHFRCYEHAVDALVALEGITLGGLKLQLEMKLDTDVPETAETTMHRLGNFRIQLNADDLEKDDGTGHIDRSITMTSQPEEPPTERRHHTASCHQKVARTQHKKNTDQRRGEPPPKDGKSATKKSESLSELTRDRPGSSQSWETTSESSSPRMSSGHSEEATSSLLSVGSVNFLDVRKIEASENANSEKLNKIDKDGPLKQSVASFIAEAASRTAEMPPLSLPEPHGTGSVTSHANSSECAQSHHSLSGFSPESDCPIQDSSKTSNKGSVKSPKEQETTEAGETNDAEANSPQTDSNDEHAAEENRAQSTLPLSMEEERWQQIVADCFPGVTVPTARQLPPEVGVFVRHIEDERHFWAQFKDEDLLQVLRSMMAVAELEAAESLQPYAPSSRRAGAFFAGEWSRVWVEEVDGDNATVFYVDWGNTDTLSVECLRTFPNDFWHTKPAALPCMLVQPADEGLNPNEFITMLVKPNCQTSHAGVIALEIVARDAAEDYHDD